MSRKSRTHNERILKFLSSGKNLTVRDAEKFGVTRLAARIHELREEGFTIYTNKVAVTRGPSKGTKVTGYRLSGDDRDRALQLS